MLGKALGSGPVIEQLQKDVESLQGSVRRLDAELAELRSGATTSQPSDRARDDVDEAAAD